MWQWKQASLETMTILELNTSIPAEIILLNDLKWNEMLLFYTSLAYHKLTMPFNMKAKELRFLR